MEYLLYYLMIAFAFALMYTINYGLAVTRKVTLTIHANNYRNAIERWKPWLYLIFAFLVAFITMPLFFLAILSETKENIVNSAVTDIINIYNRPQ